MRAIRILIAGDGAAYEGAGCEDLLYEFAPSARRDPHSGPIFSCFACRFAAPGVSALPEPDNLRYFKVLIEGAALDPPARIVIASVRRSGLRRAAVHCGLLRP